MPLYLSVSLILSCKKELSKIEDMDQAKLHTFFQEYDWKINYDAIIAEADSIYAKWPPHDFYRQYFIVDLADLPADSPFLARNVSEIKSMKTKYSGHRLTSIWNYQNPKFWRYVAIPVLTAVVVFHVANSHLSKQ